MVDTNTGCPQCGFTDFDEMEICQACGFLSEDTSVRNISFSQVVDDVSTRLREMGFHDGRDYDINPASGLPMVNGRGSVDIDGNPYGG
jgi:ribosomal protein L37E